MTGVQTCALPICFPVTIGGFGSYYSATLVPRHHYRIDLQGNHLNVPETPTEAPVNEATSSVVSVKATTAEQPVKQATTRTKKTV